MSQIEVPSWVVEIAAKAYFEDMSSLDRWNDPMDEKEREDWRDGARKIITAALGAWVVREPYRLGNRYMTQGGEEVTLNQVANYGTSYESMCDDVGVHRYTRRDFGRVTGSAHDYSDQRNIPPLYTLRQEKPE